MAEALRKSRSAATSKGEVLKVFKKNSDISEEVLKSTISAVEKSVSIRPLAVKLAHALYEEFTSKRNKIEKALGEAGYPLAASHLGFRNQSRRVIDDKIRTARN